VFPEPLVNTGMIPAAVVPPNISRVLAIGMAKPESASNCV